MLDRRSFLDFDEGRRSEKGEAVSAGTLIPLLAALAAPLTVSTMA